MSQLSDQLDKIKLSVDGLDVDIKNLHEEIQKLKDQGAGISPEDQKKLDDLQSQLLALDALNPNP